jgi:hypothetical protein
MALDATTLEDRRDFPRIRDGCGFVFPRWPSDGTADRFGLGLGDHLTIKKLLESLDQIVTLRLRLPGTDGILIVNPAPIANLPAIVEHDHLGRSTSPKPIGQFCLCIK